MVPLRRRALLALALGATIPLASAVSFYDFQRISDFGANCSSAYRTTLPDCTANDFRSNNPCSDKCAVGIQQVANLVNRECDGVAADPSTLIGIIFNGKAVESLCPTFKNGGNSAPGSAVRSVSSATGTVLPSSAAPTSASTTMAATTGASSSAADSDTASTTSAASPTSAASAAASSSGTSTSTASPAATPNPNSFGGDVNPFNGAAAATASYTFVSGVALLVASLLL